MDRIAIRAPPPPDNENKSRRFLSIGIPFIVVAAAILADVSDGTENSSNASSVNLPSTMQVVVRNGAYADVLVLLSIIYIISNMQRLRGRRGRRFKEAAIEITPLGVQLVSVYGTDCDDREQTIDHGCSSKACRVSSHLSVNYNNSNEVKVRAFLPTQQIIDVVVIEVVWPHCVWSQVAFRVVREGLITATNTASNTSIELMNEETKKSNTRQNDKESDEEKDKPMQASHNTERQPHNIHELLQQDVVEIIPCFPNECRGLLTYKQCLQVQMDIEGLLGVSTSYKTRQ